MYIHVLNFTAITYVYGSTRVHPLYIAVHLVQIPYVYPHILLLYYLGTVQVVACLAWAVV